MKLHPRERVVSQARRDLSQAILDWIRAHPDLTDAEFFSVMGSVISEQISATAKYMIREERHGSADTPGGLAGDGEDSADA